MYVTVTLQPVRLRMCYPVAVRSSIVGEKHISAVTFVLFLRTVWLTLFFQVCGWIYCSVIYWHVKYLEPLSEVLGISTRPCKWDFLGRVSKTTCRKCAEDLKWRPKNKHKIGAIICLTEFASLLEQTLARADVNPRRGAVESECHVIHECIYNYVAVEYTCIFTQKCLLSQKKTLFEK